MSAVSLSDIVSIRKGKKASETRAAPCSNSLPYIQIDEVRGTPPSLHAISPKGIKVSEGDLCIVWDGAYAGTVGYGVSGYIGSTIACMKIKNSEHWDASFVGKFLQSKFALLNDKAKGRGATIPHVNKDHLLEIAVPEFDITEQRRIAGILDKADAIRKKRKEALKLADDFLRATFLDMFGDSFSNPKNWPISSLGNISTKFSDGPFGSNLKSEHYVPRGVRVFRLQNIGVNEFIDISKAYVSEEHFASLIKHRCEPGDVIIGTMGEPNLRAFIQPRAVHEALNKADCVQCRVDLSKATPEYVCSLINEPSTLALASKLLHGQTRTRISMGTLRNLDIPIAPLSLQQEFSVRYHKIRQLKKSIKKENKEAETLFFSLTQRAFKGEL